MSSDLDMYAEDFDLKEKEKLESTIQNDQEEPEEPLTGIYYNIFLNHQYFNFNYYLNQTLMISLGESLQWEYKFSLESNEVFGPYNTDQMQKWKVEDKFKELIWVRKCNSNSDFHSFKRVDFELYL